MVAETTVRTVADFPKHDARFRLDGRTAFISGAAGHLGRAMTIALAQAGAHVILNGRTESKLESFRGELAEAGLNASIAAFDIMDRASAAAFLGDLKRLDVLVNNAITGLPLKDDISSTEAFRMAYESGVAACYDNVCLAIPALEAAVAQTGNASVINVTSIYGHVSPVFELYGEMPTSPPQYSATKGGLMQLTRYLACLLAPKGIRVNSLSPGIFPWPEIAKGHPNFITRVSARTPMGRTGHAHELGGPVVFLASDAASYVTGADILVDGGWTAW